MVQIVEGRQNLGQLLGEAVNKGITGPGGFSDVINKNRERGLAGQETRRLEGNAQNEQLRREGLVNVENLRKEALAAQSKTAENLREDTAATTKYGRDVELKKLGHEQDVLKQREALDNAKEIAEAKATADLKERTDKATKETREKVGPLQAGLKHVKEMRRLGKKGSLGIGSYGIMPETRKDRAAYSQLGKSLIALASNIPIRNQKEFDTLSAELFDPSLSDDYREGLLNSMEEIITENMNTYLDQDSSKHGQLTQTGQPQEQQWNGQTPVKKKTAESFWSK